MAAIHATHNFRHYKSGVFFDRSCREDQVSYAVIIVGYGTDEELGDYWLVKTTWGPDFGENGYARIARNRGNHCGIASFAYLDANNGRFQGGGEDATPLLWNYYASEISEHKFAALKTETLKEMEDMF